MGVVVPGSDGQSNHCLAACREAVAANPLGLAKAKKAIPDYKKASTSAEGLAELMVFYCELAAGFNCDFGLDDEA